MKNLFPYPFNDDPNWLHDAIVELVPTLPIIPLGERVDTEEVLIRYDRSPDVCEHVWEKVKGIKRWTNVVTCTHRGFYEATGLGGWDCHSVQVVRLGLPIGESLDKLEEKVEVDWPKVGREYELKFNILARECGLIAIASSHDGRFVART